MSEQKPTDPLGSMLYEFQALWRRFWGLSWWWKGSILGGAALVLIIIIAALAGGGEDDDGGDVAEITGSPTATDAGATPEPTVEIVGATPEPTVEIPTEEPTLPAVTAPECQYLNELGEQLIDVGEAFSNIGELSGRSDLLSDDWILEMAVQFIVIQLTEEAALAADPPASLDDINTQWLSIMDTSVQATELMTEGIDDIDPDKIVAASVLIDDVGVQTQEATFDLEDFTASRSGSCP